MLPGDADAAVELHAVLDELGGVRADPRLGRADELAGVAARRRPRPGRRRWRCAWHASSHIFSSATRCLSAWYEDSGRPNE